MTRRYEMTFYVSRHNPDNLVEIRDVLAREWGVEDHWHEDGGRTLVFFGGEGNLAGGESEEEFAERVARAIWKAVGFCTVTVDCKYLEMVPTESHFFGEEEYEKWKSTE